MEKIARDHFRFTQSSYLWRILPQLRGFVRTGRWPVQGIQHLDAALANGRGVILLTAHYGYPHLIPRILELHGYSVRQVIAELDRPAKKQDVERWMQGSGALKRYIFSRTKVYSDALGPRDFVASLDVRPILTALANNEILLIAGDGLRATEFKRFQVLGKDYPVPTGSIKIALLTKAVVLPAFAYPDYDAKTVRTEIQPPMTLDSAAGVEANLSKYVSALNGILERAPHFWQRWGRAKYFEEVWNWVENDQKDPFTSKTAWQRDGAEL